MADDRCLNCNAAIRTINYAMGPQVMHIDPAAGFPSEHKGTAWRHCKQRVATARPKPVDGATDECPTPGYAGKHTAVGAGAISSPYICHGCGTWFTLPNNMPEQTGGDGS